MAFTICGKSHQNTDFQNDTHQSVTQNVDNSHQNDIYQNGTQQNDSQYCDTSGQNDLYQNNTQQNYAHQENFPKICTQYNNILHDDFQQNGIERNDTQQYEGWGGIL